MSPRKLQRPRLEVRSNSRVSAVVDSEGEVFVNIGSESIGLRDAKRLRKFLEKCEAYLEARERGRV